MARRTIDACPCMTCSGRIRLRPAVRGPGEGGAGAGVGAGPVPRHAGAHHAGTRRDGSRLPPLHHVGMVVRDCDRTVSRLADAMGFGPAFAFEGIFPEAVLPDGSKGLALKGAFVWMGNTAMEIVEPLDDRSPHHAFLADHGEGLHHLAYWVNSVSDEIARMAAGGATPRVLVDGTGPGNDVPWCYLEGDMAGSALIELIERNEGSEAFYAAVFDAIGGKLPV